MTLHYYNVIKQKKIYLLLIIIYVGELYYFNKGINIVDNSISLYVYVLKVFFDKGFIILIYLLLLTLLTKYFDKPFILVRYPNISSIKKDFLLNGFFVTIFFVFMINIFPIIFFFISKKIFYKNIFLLVIYLFIQISSLLIINFIYINIFFINFNYTFCNSLIFICIYVPTFFLNSFRRDYFTPVDLIFFKNTISLRQCLIQLNLYILFLALIVVLYTKRPLKNKK